MSIKAVKFRGRHTSVRALVSLVLGSLTIIMLVVFPILSALWAYTPAWMGLVGVLAVVVNIIGLIESVRSTKERDVYMWLPIAAMIVNGVSLLIYLIIYVIGLV